MAPVPVTIITGFLGAGKTTTILNLIPQLPKDYKLALLKNEFGDVAIDSQLAASSSISGVRELLNGCICCNLVGQLGDALDTLRIEQNPDRIVIETSGSAFPATLAMEVNRLAEKSEGQHFVLDGVLTVIDVENWKGYEDTSMTARLQAQYTDFVVFNKWEQVSERRFDECLDRLGDLELQTPWVKSDKGVVGTDVVFGIDHALARQLGTAESQPHSHAHDDHHSEVEVLSVVLNMPPGQRVGVDLAKLDELLKTAPKDEIYRIKAVLYSGHAPSSSDGRLVDSGSAATGQLSKYILNWAFGRWTFTCIQNDDATEVRDDEELECALRMSVILARYEATKWTVRLEAMLHLDALEGADMKPTVHRIS